MILTKIIFNIIFGFASFLLFFANMTAVGLFLRYEKMYFESKEKLTQKEKEVNVKEVEETKEDASITNITPKDNKLETSSSNAEQDLDAFLLGDLGSSDDELGLKFFDYILSFMSVYIVKNGSPSSFIYLAKFPLLFWCIQSIIQHVFVLG